MSERYRVEQTGKGFWPYCVRAGNGTRDLYVGHKKTCDRVAAELTTAFRDGEFVGKGLYDALAAEAQALREEVAALKHSQQVLIGSRNAHRDERDAALKEVADLRMARDDFKLERDLARKNFCDEQAANYQLQAHLKACLGELSELRARVVVIPEHKDDLPPIYEDENLPAFHHYKGWNACLDELARINGKTVSASALDTLRRFATGEVGHLNSGHCPDDLEGRSARDPNCSVCRALIDTEKSK